MLTDFYGELDSSKMDEAWNLLAALKPIEDHGWCVICDFNEILTHDERRGGNSRQERQMVRFKEALEKGELFDLGWKMDNFTWRNKHEDYSFTKERLDRAIANSKWSEDFNERSVEVQVARSSDHRPILLSASQAGNRDWRVRKMFRYKASWSPNEECEEVLKTV